MILICGAVCKVTTLMRSRSSSRLAKRSSLDLKFFSTCACMASPLAAASASSAGSLVGVEVGERLLAGQYGHFQLAVLLGVLRVHRVVHGDVGHEFGLRGLEGGDEVLHGIVVGQFGYGRDLVERAGHAESADRIGAGEVGRAEAMALPRQLLHRRCFQQVQQCAAFSRPRPSACGCSTRSASGRR